VLIRSLPPDSAFWHEYSAALKRDEEQAKVDHIRARTAHYAKQAPEEGS
jgi:hypothetical protein